MRKNATQEVIIVTISNSEGIKKQYEMILTFNIRENEYAVLNNKEEDNILILKVKGEQLEPIKEENEFEEVYQTFYQYLLNVI